MELNITRALPEQKQSAPHADAELGFGRYFTDHMLVCDFAPEKGWHDARIVPFAPMSFSPACMVFHYGQAIFEGLKAYRGIDGGIRLFRYRDNLKRLNHSAERLVMPTLNIDEIGSALKQLILLDRDWIPKMEGCSLYIRPTMIATDPFLGVRPSQTYRFFVILSPVGAYYPEGFNPVSIMVNETYVRAVPGGLGAAKSGANYAASLLGQVMAKREGCTQVLWLDGKEHKYVEEAGTMNMFFVIGDEVITSPLTGSILPGITRDSVIQVLKRRGKKIVERMLSIDEIVQASRQGALKEIFGTGTAAVISPVGRFLFRGDMITVADGHTGALSKELYDELVGIQYGKMPDPYGWTERIDL